jgi:hypothetical protein
MRDRVPDVMRCLARPVHNQLLARTVPVSDQSPRFQRGGRKTLDAERALDHARGAREEGVELRGRVTHLQADHHVAAQLGIQQRTTVLRRG